MASRDVLKPTEPRNPQAAWMVDNRRQTATSPHILPHGNANMLTRSTDDDEALTEEALRLAAHVLREEADRMHRVFPGSPMIERYRIMAERMTDLRERLA